MMINETILQLAKDNNGIVTANMLDQAGIARANITKLVKSGKLEKTARGIYVLPDAWDDEFFSMQTRFKKGVFCNETALFLHDLTDRTPNTFSMMFPKNYNLTNAKEYGIKATRAKESIYTLGIVTTTSPAGHDVNAYNEEKTLCDILRPSNNVDIQIVTEAYKRYAQRKEKNIPQLSKYAKILNVENKVRSYLEVLI